MTHAAIKLTDAIIAQMSLALRECLPISTACAKLGIHRNTHTNWMARGEKGEEPFVAYYTAILKAEAESEAEVISRIRAAGEGGALIARKVTARELRTGEVITTTEETFTRPEWAANAWLAERRHPEHWAKKDNLTVEQYRAIEDARRTAEEQGLDPKEAVEETKRLLKVKV